VAWQVDRSRQEAGSGGEMRLWRCQGVGVPIKCVAWDIAGVWVRLGRWTIAGKKQCVAVVCGACGAAWGECS